MKILLETNQVGEVLAWQSFIGGALTSAADFSPGETVREALEEFIEAEAGSVFVELRPGGAAELQQGVEALHGIADVLIPTLTFSGAALTAVRSLSAGGAVLNVGHVYSAGQAALAAAAGATYVTTSVQRLDQAGYDGLATAAELAEVLATSNTKLIVGGLTTPAQARDALGLGADFVAVTAQVLESLQGHPLTALATAEVRAGFERAFPGGIG